MGESGRQRVTVIGAGIVGTSTALFLQRDGHEVTLLDPVSPGHMTSFGNAGVISYYSLLPVPQPGLLQKLPAMLMDPTSSLSIRWAYLPQLLPWLLRFAMNCRQSKFHAGTEAMAALTTRAGQAHDILIQQCGLADLVRPGGWLKVARSKEAVLASTLLEREAYDRHGLPYEILDRKAVSDLEPALAVDLVAGVHLTANRAVQLPHLYTEGIARTFLERGGKWLQASAEGFGFDGERIDRVATTGGEIATDTVVLATGAYGKKLAAIGRTPVPINAERGYHVVMPHPETTLRRPTYVVEGGFVMAPMIPGIRLTGGVELASPRAAPNFRRIRRLAEKARQFVPALTGEILSEWQGARPSLPDTVPVIGRSPRTPNLYLAFGHQHVGLTLGPLTGVLIADLVAGRTPPIDMTPYAPDRSFV